jgi:endonuclease III
MKPEYWDRAKLRCKKGPGDGRDHPFARGVFLMRRRPFLTLARAICGQQISVKAAQSVWDRICLCLDNTITPEAVVAQDRKKLRACGLSDRKTEYIADLAQHFADGRIHVHRWPAMADEEIIAELVEVRGIRRWTAGCSSSSACCGPCISARRPRAAEGHTSKLFQGTGFAGAHYKLGESGRGARWPPGTCGAVVRCRRILSRG